MITIVSFNYRDCVALQDPHCAWDSKQQTCAWVGNRQFPNPERFLQNVEHGKSEICNKLPALLPGDRHSNRNPGTKKPLQSESEMRQKTDDIQNEILIEVVETNILSEEKGTSNNKHETGKISTYKANFFNNIFPVRVINLYVEIFVTEIFQYSYRLANSRSSRRQYL